MDALDDYTSRVAEALATGEVSQEKLYTIANAVRHEWIGSLVHRRGFSVEQEMLRRNIAIRRDYRKGERIALLARRYKLSWSMVKKIVSA